MRRILSCLAVVACLAWAQTASAQANLPAYRLVDLTDDYAAFFDRTAGLSPEARLTAFRAEIAPLFPGFYDPERLPGSTVSFDARLAASFERFPRDRERYARVAGEFNAMMDDAMRSFVEHFPDMGPIGDIYLLNSLGEMEGTLREFRGSRGRLVLVFGVDRIARSHRDFSTERPFFHHELFHVYHFARTGGCPPPRRLWCQLWREGLADYVAHRLNPEATDTDLSWMNPEPIRASVDANLREAVCQTRARLNSAARDDFYAWFSYSRFSSTLPPRFGYYLGYRVAEHAARTRSLQELARLPNAQAREVVQAGLGALADCAS